MYDEAHVVCSPSCRWCTSAAQRESARRGKYSWPAAPRRGTTGVCSHPALGAPTAHLQRNTAWWARLGCWSDASLIQLVENRGRRDVTFLYMSDFYGSLCRNLVHELYFCSKKAERSNSKILVLRISMLKFSMLQKTRGGVRTIYPYTIGYWSNTDLIQKKDKISLFIQIT